MEYQKYEKQDNFWTESSREEINHSGKWQKGIALFEDIKPSTKL